MYLKQIDHLPTKGARNSKAYNNRLQSIVLDFYESDMDFAEVEFDTSEYASSSSLQSGLVKAIRSLKADIDVCMIQGGVYLRRRD